MSLNNNLPAKPKEIDEDLIIKAIKAKRFKKTDVDTILKAIDEHQAPLTSIRIHLYEKVKDFCEAFRLTLMS